jgi:hypothetical protein
MTLEAVLVGGLLGSSLHQECSYSSKPTQPDASAEDVARAFIGHLTGATG